ncbi:hypothetical protein NTCA1_41230 [Novosphingobium sp. TCA1]|nr:hypothetical protein NTCA1_41230 [Novosphingobium sp. TCA1]
MARSTRRISTTASIAARFLFAESCAGAAARRAVSRSAGRTGGALAPCRGTVARWPFVTERPIAACRAFGAGRAIIAQAALVADRALVTAEELFVTAAAAAACRAFVPRRTRIARVPCGAVAIGTSPTAFFPP